MLSVVRMNARQRSFPSSSLLMAPWFLQSNRLLALIFSSRAGHSEMDKYIWPLARFFLRARIKRFAPDVIHAHFGPDGCLISPLAEELNIPLAVSFYGYDVSRLMAQRGDIWREKYQRLFSRASLLIGISEHILHKLRGLGAEENKLVRIPLGCHVDRFLYRDPAAEYKGGTVRFLHVGRLTAKKNPLKLLQALALARQLLPQGPDLHLTIAGTGELEQQCRKTITRLDLEGNVDMVGAVSHDQVPNLFSRSHIYSQYCETASNGDMEGLGVTFIEAQASGLPVVTTRHNGIPDVVRHGRTGLLSMERDVQGMAQNMVALAENPGSWSEMGRQGRSHVLRNFTMGNTVGALCNAYSEIASPTQARTSALRSSVQVEPARATS
jgi:glycosyltransferase involved in cell wall biosynthesis